MARKIAPPEAGTSPIEQDVLVPLSNLRFDPENPRMPDTRLEDEDDVICHLIDGFDVEELVQSILASGWIDYEPLIVERGTNIVFEGNRRLAALRLITDKGLRKRIEYTLPDIDGARTPPHSVRVRYVSNRIQARRFIAFKHINGPFKWDAFAKAKYAVEWLREGENIDAVSRMLGDNHNTIRRLVMGYYVLEQAQRAGFDIDDRTKKRFAFSHLYTAVSRPAVRKFLDIEDDEDEVHTFPVPDDKADRLLQLMSWLYGQEKKKEPALVVSQNPNLNQLVRVIENKDGLSSLVKYRRLDQAFEAVEPPSGRFKEAMIAANRQCENALALSSYFDGDESQLAMVRNLATTVRNLRDAMVKKSVSATDDL